MIKSKYKIVEVRRSYNLVVEETATELAAQLIKEKLQKKHTDKKFKIIVM